MFWIFIMNFTCYFLFITIPLICINVTSHKTAFMFPSGDLVFRNLEMNLIIKSIYSHQIYLWHPHDANEPNIYFAISEWVHFNLPSAIYQFFSIYAVRPDVWTSHNECDFQPTNKHALNLYRLYYVKDSHNICDFFIKSFQTNLHIIILLTCNIFIE